MSDHLDANRLTKVTLPAVLGYLWKSPEGNFGFMTANLTGEEKSFRYKINPAELGIPTGESGWKLRQIRFEETVELGEAPANEVIREEKLQPWEFRVVVLERDRAGGGAPQASLSDK
jgi:hypothetical protein